MSVCRETPEHSWYGRRQPTKHIKQETAYLMSTSTQHLHTATTKISGYLKMMVTDGQQDFDLPFYQVGLFLNNQRDDSSFDGMVKYEHDDDGILEEIVDYIHTSLTNGTSQLLLQVQYLYEQNCAFVDYKEFYHKHPEAVIAFFRRSDLTDYYLNGVIGTEIDHGPPCTIVGPLSPLLEEEMNNNTNNIGGDEAQTLYKTEESHHPTKFQVKTREQSQTSIAYRC
jgi:hypothetical protein